MIIKKDELDKYLNNARCYKVLQIQNIPVGNPFESESRLVDSGEVMINEIGTFSCINDAHDFANLIAGRISNSWDYGVTYYTPYVVIVADGITTVEEF